MDPLPPLVGLAIIASGWVYMVKRRDRERAGNAPLRGEIEARVCFETRLDRVSILGTGGFRGTRGYWISFRGPKRLVVGTNAFMISMPQALREYVFTGCESSMTFSQMPSGLAARDWIVITGQAGGRQVQLAITNKERLPDIWQALVGTGITPVLAAQKSARTAFQPMRIAFLGSARSVCCPFAAR
jgi:hypothetical protein